MRLWWLLSAILAMALASTILNLLADEPLLGRDTTILWIGYLAGLTVALITCPSFRGHD